MGSNLRTPVGYRIWGYGNFAHICFESSGCRFRKAGYCVMCNYGAGRILSKTQAVLALHEAVKEWKTPIKRLLLGTCGSIFDEAEMPREVLFAVVSEVAKMNLESVIFETHYETITQEILETLRILLPNKQIAVELGFESANPIVLREKLHKYMDLEQLNQTIDTLKKYRICPILNVFLGAPGLSPKAQLEDTLYSIHWAFEHGAEEVVVFPANVKPDTELWRQMKSGKYQVPSSWLLVELLSRLSDEELGATSISWFGDRQNYGVDTDILPPKTCSKCEGRLLQFYFDFMSDFHVDTRRNLLQRCMVETVCQCKTNLHKQLSI